MLSSLILEQAFNALSLHGAGGFTAFDKHVPDSINKPVLSHICFKFENINAYKDHVTAADSLGHLKSEIFNGKEITWCKLHQPITKNDLRLEWLEIVEPKTERNAFNGVTSLGFYANGLTEVIKIPTMDENIIYRYMGQNVQPKLDQ